MPVEIIEQKRLQLPIQRLDFGGASKHIVRQPANIIDRLDGVRLKLRV